MNMERLWDGSDRGNIHNWGRTTLFAICQPYVVERNNAKGIAGLCVLVLVTVKPRDAKSPYR